MNHRQSVTTARFEASIATAGLNPQAPATWRLYLETFVALRGGERPEDAAEIRALQARIHALAEGQTQPRA
ncbi:MAG TPA: hypothetical protein VD948_03150 [Rhodothermales bacterium]|nr:hypothetical protein [Rhodothermales bacterium]